MITIPDGFLNDPLYDVKFIQLVDFFNQLEENLQYPNCEGKADAGRILAKAQNDLIMLGLL